MAEKPLQQLPWYAHLAAPKASEESTRRREFILNILLLGSMLLSLITLAQVIINYVKQGSYYTGVPLPIISAIFLGFVALYTLSRIRFSTAAAFIFISAYFLISTYTLYHWGFVLPQGLLLYCLVIVMSGVLIGTRFAFLVTSLISVTITYLAYIETSHYVAPDWSWLYKPFKLDDVVGFIATFLVILSVTWLWNRETERALLRAQHSERALKEERDQLEIKVEERTEELKKAQMEKMLQLSRFADFGRLASGLFHDLVNPLTTVSLNLEQLGMKERSLLLERAIDATKKMEQFVEMARKEIRNQRELSIFSLIEEIKGITENLRYLTKKQRVAIEFVYPPEDVQMYGSTIKFEQVITNLLINAIEAYQENGSSTDSKQKRKVVITLKQVKNIIYITVQDWATGISDSIAKKIFDPFFTTKSSETNTGIGLAICKEIVEKEFGGSITATGKAGSTAIFAIEFPANLP